MDIELIERLFELVDRFNIGEFEYEKGDLRLVIRKQLTPYIQFQPVASVEAREVQVTQTQPVSVGEVKERVESATTEPHIEAESSNLVAIRAPLVGTFYRAPSPDAPPYVKEGDIIEKGQVVCIIEAMKIMNEIESDVRGRVVKVLVENGKPVEYGQPLFLIEPM